MSKIRKRILSMFTVLTLVMGCGIVSSAAELPIVKFSSVPSAETVQKMRKSYKAPLPVEDSGVTRGITPDGYQRVYGSVVIETKDNNDTYGFLGEVSTYNQTPSNATLHYSQDSSVTIKWDVSGNIEGSAEISVPFLSKVEATVGAGVSRSQTVSKGASLGTEITVSPYKHAKITAYQKAVYVTGYINYNDYSPSGGAPVRSGRETVSGSVLKSNAYHFDSKQW